MTQRPDLRLSTLRSDYLAGRCSPRQLLTEILARIPQHAADNIWIRALTAAELEPYLRALELRAPAELPLYGIPFAIKDNIDLAGVPTSAGCPEYAYLPQRSAHVVECLIAAGAVPVGKTNLDQFATGLVGVRSPYGATRNSIDPAYISGGSSSGSAVAVAHGLASFALGTDTAGSGRVPAAYNELLGLKPSKGLLSTRGVVPACRSLDCVSIFGLDAADVDVVLAVAADFDPVDPYARELVLEARAAPASFRFGVPRPDQLTFDGDQGAAALYAGAVQRLTAAGGEPIELDFEPYLAAARLLYEGPWVAERYAAIRPFIETRPDALLPVIRSIIEPAGELRAVDAFAAQYRLAELKRAADAELARVDLILMPTAPTIYTIAQVQADPIALNSRLGTYTNFMNLLDYAALSIPAGRLPSGLPWGVTLLSWSGSDRRLLALAERYAAVPEPQYLELAVCGAHLAGLALNHQLTERGASLVAVTRTAPRYRLYALAGGPPARPGLVRDESAGATVEVELWRMPLAAFGGFMAGIPAPLGIGSLELADGRWVKGFICEPYALGTAMDVTRYGGWRAYLAER